MKCLGLARNFRRCNRQGDWRFFCHDHAKQPLGWLFVLIFTVGGGTASILSYLGHGPVLPTGQKGANAAEANSARPDSSPSVLPRPKELGKPDPNAAVKPNLDSERHTQPSLHLRKARTLYAQANYQEALRECDAELSIDPHNSDALVLRKRIAHTIQILNRQ